MSSPELDMLSVLHTWHSSVLLLGLHAHSPPSHVRSFFLYLKYSTKGLCTVSLYVDSLSHIFASLFELRQSNTYAKKQLFSFPNLMLMPLPPLFFSKTIQCDFS